MEIIKKYFEYEWTNKNISSMSIRYTNVHLKTNIEAAKTK